MLSSKLHVHVALAFDAVGSFAHDRGRSWLSAPTSAAQTRSLHTKYMYMIIQEFFRESA